MASKKAASKKAGGKRASTKKVAADSGSAPASQGGAIPRTKPFKGTNVQLAAPELHDVRVHSDAYKNPADKMGAKAFTTGQDVFFKQGEYMPPNSAGRELLAHEAAHVMQQK